MAELEQYSLRECAELIGFPEDIHGETSKISRVNAEKGNLHTIHRLGNSTIVITKPVNWWDAIKKLQKRNSVNFLAVENKSLESLCSHNKQLLGKCNALFKKKQIESFYTINGKIKMKYNSVNGKCKTESSYAEDLLIYLE